MAKHTFTELYDLLEVSPDASQTDIKRAFRNKARQLHPDTDGGDAEKMIELNAAYTILKDPKKRAKYDRDGITEFSTEKVHIPQGYEKLHEAFREVTQNGPSPFMRKDFKEADLVKAMQDHLRKHSQDNSSSLKEARRGLNKTRNYLERLKAPEDSWLVKAIQADISLMEGSIQSGEEEVAAYEGALNLLEGHSFRYDREARAERTSGYHDGGIVIVDDMGDTPYAEMMEEMLRKVKGFPPFGSGGK